VRRPLSHAGAGITDERRTAGVAYGAEMSQCRPERGTLVIPAIIGTMPQRRLRRVLIVCVVAMLFVLVQQQSTSAAGDRSLERLIMSDPFPSGVAASPAKLSSLASGMQEAMQGAAGKYGATTATAAEGWYRGGSKTRFVFVVLVALNIPNQTASQLATQADAAASAEAGTFCSGASAAAPLVFSRVSRVPHGAFVKCSRSPSGINAEAITTARANVFAMVIATSSTVAQSKLTSLALVEYRKLSSHDTFIGGSGSTLSIGAQMPMRLPVT
jgi:hypothetical protein